MLSCQCLKVNGQKCTRTVDLTKGNNFCWQHQNCQTPILGIHVNQPIGPFGPNGPYQPLIIPKKKIPLKKKDILFHFDGIVDPSTGLPSHPGTLFFLKDGDYLGQHYHTGDKLSGQFKNGELIVGQITYANGQYLSGGFESGQLKSGKGKLITDQFIYEGGLIGQLPQGEGTITFLVDGHYLTNSYKKNDTYTGYFNKGEFRGEGTLSNPNGLYMKGTFKAGKLNGKGVYYTDKWKYEGDLVDNKAHGQGQIIVPNGKTYIGGWKFDKYDGKGLLTYPDGSTYDGFWKENAKQGEGQYTYKKDGVTFTYIGNWINGVLKEGTVTYSTGEKFTGQFKDLKPVKGKFVYPNGNIYDGEMTNGKPHGQGTLVEKDKKTYIGQFQNGLFIGVGQVVMPTGNQYIGEFKNWKLSQGQLKSPLGFNYHGPFKNWRMQGQGEIQFNYNNMSFKGQFENDKLEDGQWENLPSKFSPSQLKGKTPLDITVMINQTHQNQEPYGLAKVKKVTSKLATQSMKLNLGFSNQNVNEWQKICQHLSKDYGLPQLQSIAKTYNIDPNLPKKKLCQLIAIEVDKCTNDTDLLGDEISEHEPNVFHYRDPKTHVNYCFTENDAPYFKDKNLNPYNKQPLDAQTYAQIKAFMKLPVKELVVTPAMNTIFDQSGLAFDFEQRKQFVFLVQMTNTFPEFKARPDNTFPITVPNQGQWLLLYTQIMSLLT
jgi:hypothetical protein